MILECFDDLIMQVLCVAAVVSMGIGIYKDGWSHGWIDGTSIIVAVLIIITVIVKITSRRIFGLTKKGSLQRKNKMLSKL